MRFLREGGGNCWSSFYFEIIFKIKKRLAADRPEWLQCIGRGTPKFSIYLLFLLYANIVFFINIARVIGPTPPGTGVIQLAFASQLSKSTSPAK